MGTKTKEKKLAKRMSEDFPQAARVVEQHINKKPFKKNPSSDSCKRKITHHEVEIVKAWIQQAIEL
jgi:hypothetical protein